MSIKDQTLEAIFTRFMAPRAYDCLRSIYGYDEFMKRVKPELRDDMNPEEVVEVMEKELKRITAKLRKALDAMA